MLKFRMYFDKDREIAWLNEMVSQGWAMTGFFAGVYSFTPCEPGAYEYQMDLGRGFFSVPETYRSLLCELGIELVQSWGPWIILRKKADGTPFALYSDAESAIGHYGKIRRMLKSVLAAEIVCFLLETYAISAGEPGLRGLYLCFAFFLVFLIVKILGAVAAANARIAALREGAGLDPGVCEARAGRCSPLIPAGLCCNAIALLAAENISSPIRRTLTLLAAILMLAGVYFTSRRRGR